MYRYKAKDPQTFQVITQSFSTLEEAKRFQEANKNNHRDSKIESLIGGIVDGIMIEKDLEIDDDETKGNANHFIISFEAILDQNEIHHGLIGSLVGDMDYESDIVMDTIINYYKNGSYKAKEVAVNILEAKLVSKEEYKASSKNFIQLGDF